MGRRLGISSKEGNSEETLLPRTDSHGYRPSSSDYPQQKTPRSRSRTDCLRSNFCQDESHGHHQHDLQWHVVFANVHAFEEQQLVIREIRRAGQYQSNLHLAWKDTLGWSSTSHDSAWKICRQLVHQATTARPHSCRVKDRTYWLCSWWRVCQVDEAPYLQGDSS
jgi:hypothetical protein